jgi:hypothetical protein
MEAGCSKDEGPKESSEDPSIKSEIAKILQKDMKTSLLSLVQSTIDFSPPTSNPPVLAKTEPIVKISPKPTPKPSPSKLRQKPIAKIEKLQSCIEDLLKTRHFYSRSQTSDDLKAFLEDSYSLADVKHYKEVTETLKKAVKSENVHKRLSQC